MSATKGPWVAHIPEHLKDAEAESEIGHPYFFIDAGYEASGKCADSDELGFHIAAYLSPADAHLIAAAPELYQGCKDSLEMLDKWCMAYADTQGFEWKGEPPIFEQLRNAIAKAEGRS